MAFEDSMTSAQTGASPAWQWVPVRLDLHRGLIETEPGEPAPAAATPAQDRERILALIRERAVPALYTAAETGLQLMVPVRVSEHRAFVARASAEGELSVGEDLDALMEQILEVPGLEYASWQTGGERTEHPEAVAMLRTRRAVLPLLISRISAHGWFDVAAADQDWELVAAQDYEELLELVDATDVDAVVLDTDGEHRALTFCPAGSEPITLEWGPVRDAVTDYPEGSPAELLQAEATGRREAALHEAARVAGVATLAEAYALDPVGRRRLEQYARDANGRYAPESVLQLLGLPDLAAKVLDGRRVLAQRPDHERLRYEGVGRAYWTASQDTARRAGLRAADEARRNPWAVAAALGIGLGAWALRRRR